ncbi:MAG: hypothetical protein Q7U20_10970 [Caulobacter sp.]|nr:hypothetical protein [Caulobacter sp.]
MTDPAPQSPYPKPPANRGPLALAFIGAGIALMVTGQVFLENAPMAYAGLAILAVGIVFGVQSQRGK